MVALSTDPIDELENIANGTRMFIMDTGAKYIYDEENQTWRDMTDGSAAVFTKKVLTVYITSGDSEYQSGVRVIDNKVSGTLVYNDGYSVVLHVDADTEPATEGEEAPAITVYLDGDEVSGTDIVIEVTDNRESHEIKVVADGYVDYVQTIEMSKLFLKPEEVEPEPEPEPDDNSSRVGYAIVGVSVVGEEGGGDSSDSRVGTAIVGISTVGEESNNNLVGQAVAGVSRAG